MFQGGPTGDDIWVVNADGSGLTNLTKTPSGIGTATRGRRGRDGPGRNRILFTRTILLPPDGDVLETDVWVMNANGGGQSNLTHTGSEGQEGRYYTWSPDGTQIAFTSARGGPSGIWVMGADGSNPHQLADGVSFDPDWSPDGKRIAFLRQGAEIDVWAMNADGSNEDQLTNQPGDLKAEVSWSPDGSKIVYRFAASPGSSDIWTVNADGNGEFNVTKNGGDNTTRSGHPMGARSRLSSAWDRVNRWCKSSMPMGPGYNPTSAAERHRASGPTGSSSSYAHLARSPTRSRWGFCCPHLRLYRIDRQR